ncbi:MAG: MATE family efflux transporter, partial [Alphaproteobacteria bacterium CG11_big_fil_rev_8_21_14_0_20_44_7]
MLDKQRSKQILALTVPILAGMLSQNILNLVDAAMVGSLGTAALGAVGIASFVNFFCAALFIGMASGIQAMVARNMGEGRESKAAYPLNGGLLLNILFAIPTTILLVHLSP